ncbi:MAG: helix-turn-helix transcriptional regulator [Oscillospiraceae bacterium]|nr:helix-turn-helix transcriptional regulator [Oscillospiraceae bacterium]
MDTRKAVADRIYQLCKTQLITPNALSYRAGVPQSTIKSILNNETQNAGIVTIKKLCDGFDISLYDFFDADIFRTLEQEIK